ncbi:hypothetical protein AVEN_188094-1 [Araneus ventricosus]|uniref:Uncharacterized protein n=1 Tax=Araneus ventricosus TaxID=182803 RepID=A0A4Y2KA35_ARAVE|nr:hypothetical protein AVEN_188094-1 [Araneus ventricosus]
MELILRWTRYGLRPGTRNQPRRQHLLEGNIPFRKKIWCYKKFFNQTEKNRHIFTIKEHPRPAEAPWSAMKDWPPRQKANTVANHIIVLVTSGSCDDFPFYGGTIRLR